MNVPTFDPKNPSPRVSSFFNGIRIVVATVALILVLYYAFAIFVDHQITFATVGPAIGQLFIFINFWFLTKPHKPKNEQTTRETPETKQN